MELGIIYLIQPAELIETDRFKIGFSSKPNLDWKNKYASGTRFICIMESPGCSILKTIINAQFKKKYDMISTDFFEGDEKEMIQDFFLVVCNYKDFCIELDQNMDL